MRPPPLVDLIGHKSKGEGQIPEYDHTLTKQCLTAGWKPLQRCCRWSHAPHARQPVLSSSYPSNQAERHCVYTHSYHLKNLNHLKVEKKASVRVHEWPRPQESIKQMEERQTYFFRFQTSPILSPDVAGPIKSGTLAIRLGTGVFGKYFKGKFSGKQVPEPLVTVSCSAGPRTLGSGVLCQHHHQKKPKIEHFWTKEKNLLIRGMKSSK